MSESTDKQPADAMPIQSENIAFAAEEMVTCAECARKNPPTRLNCVYCGAEFEISEVDGGKIKPTLRRLEAWEKGFNLIVSPADPAGRAAIARDFKLEPEAVGRLFESGKRLPIARVESDKECRLLRDILAKHGVESMIVSDEELAADTPPRRLRGIEFGESGARFVLFNDESTIEIEPDELEVIVTGAVFQKAIEATEKRKKGQTRMINATETASDEPVLDIYIHGEALGFRITTAGFDFSCLGAEKGILARENLKRLTVRLNEFAPKAKLVDDYLKLRDVLGEVWEVENRKDSQGMKRSSFGRFDLMTVSSSSNLRQFNKYSRLQRHVI
ncbi:MAG: hypothetical protein IPN69_18055 [Acidobacteria bacterium]|nr:hypothetical protein [Acidobacteriota bacterium]